MAVNKDRMREWVKALRSGEFEQGTGCLSWAGDNTFCCLGVACEVMLRAEPDSLLKVVDDGAQASYDIYVDILPSATREWYGLPSSDPPVNDKGISATVANDSEEWTFTRIADEIEEFYALKED